MDHAARSTHVPWAIFTVRYAALGRLSALAAVRHQSHTDLACLGEARTAAGLAYGRVLYLAKENTVAVCVQRRVLGAYVARDQTATLHAVNPCLGVHDPGMLLRARKIARSPATDLHTRFSAADEGEADADAA